MTPDQLLTYGAGAIALLLLFRIYWRGQKSQASVDDRAMRHIDELQQQNRELSERNSRITDACLEMARTHTADVMRAVETARAENRQSLERAHSKIEAAEITAARALEEVKACRRDHAASEGRVEALERILSTRAQGGG